MKLLLVLLPLFVISLATEWTPEEIKKFREGRMTVRDRAAFNAKRKHHTMDKLIALKEKQGEKGFAEELEKRKAALKRLAELRGKNPKKLSAADQKSMEQMSKWRSDKMFVSKGSIVDANLEISEYLYEGDILLSSKEIEKLIAKESGSPRSKRGAPRKDVALWPTDRPIPFVFAADHHDDADKAMIRKGFKTIEAQTCLRFEEDDKPANRIRILNGWGCYSVIGMSGGEQPLSLMNNIFGTCMLNGIVEHEILHALGIGHTQSRYDRDEYVSINMENINQNERHNFNKLNENQNNNFGVPYDYGSVMHYGPTDFAIDDKQPVLVPRNPEYTFSMGQRLTLTYNDIKQVNALYNCDKSCPTKISCGNNRGYQNPKNCSVCICNEFFSGDNCEKANFGEKTVFRKIEYRAGVVDWNLLGMGGKHEREAHDPEGAQRAMDDYSQFSKFFYYFSMEEPGYGMEFEIIAKNPALECTESCWAGSVTIIETNIEDDFSGEGKRFCCDKHNGYHLNSTAKYVGVKITQIPGTTVTFGVQASIMKI